MKRNNKNGEGCPRRVALLRALPLVLVALLTAASAYVIFVIGMSVDEILSYTPDDYLLSTAFILVFYAVKSLSVFFPIVAVYIFVGNCYPLWAALIVNLFGLAVTLAVPYAVGRVSGPELVSHIVAFFDRRGKSGKLTEGNTFFACYMLRIVSVLPADLVSLMFGAVKADFPRYIAGSLAGSVPSMIAITCVGATITDPTSPAFIISAAATVLIVLVSLLVHKIKENNENNTNPAER